MVVNAELDNEFKIKKIDKKLTLSILEKYNSGTLKKNKPVEVSRLPRINNKNIIDRKTLKNFNIQTDLFYEKIGELLPEYIDRYFGEKKGDSLLLTKRDLETIGILLYPKTVFGILNGGSATSYIDTKKNRAFNPALYNIHEALFKKLALFSRGKAKGITPAFTNPDGSPGPSFMELKLRGLLIEALKYQILTGNKAEVLFPLFQMTSTYNNDQILNELSRYSRSTLFEDLISETGIPITRVETGIQPLLAAYTPVKPGKPLELFTQAWGKPNSLLPIPGGHGQNFFVLKKIYENLYHSGKRFAYLGNIDNLGSTVDPVSLALLAITGKQAAFDFAFKTPVDIKGGILIREKTGNLNCVDIGCGISGHEVKRYEENGVPVLFNCATGLFDLEYLVPNLDKIIDQLPLRLSNQDKDAGRYSQAEQVTWEIMGIMDDFLVFAVDKYDRFLAAKMLIENILTSGIKLDDPDFPDTDDILRLKTTSRSLYAGLTNKLQNVYGFSKTKTRWIPKSIDLLKTEYLELSDRLT